MPPPSVRVHSDGPLFIDPVGSLQSAADRALIDIAVMGANKVKEQLYPGHGRITANLRNHVSGGLVKSLHAQIDAGELRYGRNLVYAGWVEGISSLNKRSVFKGYGMFKNVADWLKRGSPEIDQLFEDALHEEFE
jgi:hypothetical protein